MTSEPKTPLQLKAENMVKEEELLKIPPPNLENEQNDEEEDIERKEVYFY